MKILITGAAGFIGHYTALHYAERGEDVVGLDNINDYYDIGLKHKRGQLGGFSSEAMESGKMVTSSIFPNYRFIKGDLTDKNFIDTLFKEEKFDIVCNLAAQAGVRYSIENPYSYIQSNIVGFINILEACRHNPVKHLVYASSSSVYGMTEKTPFSEDDKCDNPASLYAATKKADELMAHVYSSLYKIPSTGLRFFTVYGPLGRPDMAPVLFMKAIMEDRPIKVFNHGNLFRDFTYIDDIVKGIAAVINSPAPSGNIPYKIFNIGNSKPVALMDFIHAIEDVTEKKAILQYTEMQPGDVYITFADTTKLEKEFGYKPQTSIIEGVKALYESMYGKV